MKNIKVELVNKMSAISSIILHFVLEKKEIQYWKLNLFSVGLISPKKDDNTHYKRRLPAIMSMVNKYKFRICMICMIQKTGFPPGQ